MTASLRRGIDEVLDDARTRLDRLAEIHGHPVALALEPGSTSVMMSRAPRP